MIISYCGANLEASWWNLEEAPRSKRRHLGALVESQHRFDAQKRAVLNQKSGLVGSSRTRGKPRVGKGLYSGGTSNTMEETMGVIPMRGKCYKEVQWKVVQC